MATFKLACDTSCNHDGATLWVLPSYVKETFTNALKRRMCAEERSSPLAASVRNEEKRPRILLQSHPSVISFHLKRYATDLAAAEYNATILRYVHPSNMAP